MTINWPEPSLTLPSRCQFLAGSAAVSLLPLAACGGPTMSDYAAIAARLRVPLSGPDAMLGFVRYATLAANQMRFRTMIRDHDGDIALVCEVLICFFDV